MTRDAAFYFANLAADATRLAVARERGDEATFLAARAPALATLARLRAVGRPEAYEEGLLMLRAVELTPREGLPRFRSDIANLAKYFVV